MVKIENHPDGEFRLSFDASDPPEAVAEALKLYEGLRLNQEGGLLIPSYGSYGDGPLYELKLLKNATKAPAPPRAEPVQESAGMLSRQRLASRSISLGPGQWVPSARGSGSFVWQSAKYVWPPIQLAQAKRRPKRLRGVELMRKVRKAWPIWATMHAQGRVRALPHEAKRIQRRDEMRQRRR